MLDYLHIGFGGMLTKITYHAMGDIYKLPQIKATKLSPLANAITSLIEKNKGATSSKRALQFDVELIFDSQSSEEYDQGKSR